MTSRRPRFKPSAILSARRPAVAFAAGKIKTEVTSESIQDDANKNEIHNEPSTLSRRIIKPSVCLPVRKRNFAAASTSANIKDEPVSVVDQISIEENTKETISLFKSPIMSPSMQSSQYHARFVELSPLIDQQQSTECDENINQLSPAKLRQRIRPTPCFGNRRNSSSQNGYISESDDESSRRQRHLSTSSSASVHGAGSSIRPLTGIARMRTESACSILSDIGGTVREISKSKKFVRSEELQRVINAKKEFDKRFNGKTPDKSRLTMLDMIHYNPTTNPMKSPAIKAKSISDRRLSCMSTTSSIAERCSVTKPASVVSSVKSVKCESVIKDERKVNDGSLAMPVPQLKLGPNGEIILDEKSLVIETTGDKEARETLANADIVYDDEFSGTSGFYKRNVRSKAWSREETIRFYRCLRTIGTDFSMMLDFFPNRNRRDLKVKFKKEERISGGLVTKALLHPGIFRIEELRDDFEKEDMEIENQKKTWEEAKQKRMDDKRNYLKSSRKHSMSKSMRTISDGENIYEYEFVNPPLRKNKTHQKAIKSLVNQDSSLYTNVTTSMAPEPIKFSKSMPQHNNENLEVPTIGIEEQDNFEQHDKCSESLFKVTPKDILNMDIIFDNTDPNHVLDKTSSNNQSDYYIRTRPKTSFNDIGEMDMDIDYDCSNAMGETKPCYVNTYDPDWQEIDNDTFSGQSSSTNGILNDNSNNTNSCDDDVQFGSLVVIARPDSLDINNVIHEVFLMSPVTGAISDEPLDLPPDIIERIKSSLLEGSN